jgi:hypothetical protein
LRKRFCTPKNFKKVELNKQSDKSEFGGCSDEHCVHDDALRATMISLRENDDMIAPKRGEATHRLRSNHRLA